MTDAEKRARIAVLIAKKTAGTITKEEQTELDNLILGPVQIKTRPDQVQATTPIVGMQEAAKIALAKDAALRKPEPLEALAGGITPVAGMVEKEKPLDDATRRALEKAAVGDVSEAPTMSSINDALAKKNFTEGTNLPLVSTVVPPKQHAGIENPNLYPMPESAIVSAAPKKTAAQIATGGGITASEYEEALKKTAPAQLATGTTPEGGMKFGDKISKLAKDFGVPLLHILQAGAYGKAGLAGKVPTALDAIMAEKEKTRERDLMEKLEMAKEARATAAQEAQNQFTAQQQSEQLAAQQGMTEQELANRLKIAQIGSAGKLPSMPRTPGMELGVDL